MSVPFNDLKRRYRGRREDFLADIGALIDGGMLIGGPAVTKFETVFARWCGVSHAIGVANGTDALELALRSVGVEAGDEVACVANAGGYATVACLGIGATPVYIDIDPMTLQMQSAAVLEALSPRLKAVIVTHLYGWMNDVAGIRFLLNSAGRSDVSIVEDCAQAHGASRDGALAGSLGDAAAFSFYPTKNIGALGDAGCVVTDDPTRASAIKELRQYGWSSKYLAIRQHGRNSRLDPIQALGLTRELSVIDRNNTRRRAIWSAYRDRLPQGWRLVGVNEPCFVAHLAILVAPDAAARDRLHQFLQARHIGTDIHYPHLDCDQPAWRDHGRCVGNLSVSRDIVTRILSLPCFPELSEAECEAVMEAVCHGA